MNRRGDLLIPFAIILSLFSMLLGGLFGNAVGRKNQAEMMLGPLDVGKPPTSSGLRAYPNYEGPLHASPDTQTEK